MAGWAAELVWVGKFVSPDLKFEQYTIQAIASRYTDYAVVTSEIN
jgi:hypothetical protein